jgi:hypothetical protein
MTLCFSSPSSRTRELFFDRWWNNDASCKIFFVFLLQCLVCSFGFLLLIARFASHVALASDAAPGLLGDSKLPQINRVESLPNPNLPPVLAAALARPAPMVYYHGTDTIELNITSYISSVCSNGDALMRNALIYKPVLLIHNTLTLRKQNGHPISTPVPQTGQEQ